MNALVNVAGEGRAGSSAENLGGSVADAVHEISIAGLVKTSLLDYPGALCSTLFLSGCNFRCPYCHNRDLVIGSSGLRASASSNIPLTQVKAILLRRQGLIDGVCVTGGEPTLTPELPALAEAVKDLGMKVKLDTNGTNPDAVGGLIRRGLVDYVAMDVKAPREKYEAAAGARVSLSALQATIDLLMGSGVEYEFRTTVVPELLTEPDMRAIGRWIDGAATYVLQQFRPVNTLDVRYARLNAYPPERLRSMANQLRQRFGRVLVRGV